MEGGGLPMCVNGGGTTDVCEWRGGLPMCVNGGGGGATDVCEWGGYRCV